MKNGERVRNSRSWYRRRRPEIQQLFETNVYGHSPNRPQFLSFEVFDVDRHALNDTAVRKQVTLYFSARKDGPRADMLIYLPAGAPKPVPVVLGLNFSGNHSIIADPGIRLGMIWDNKKKISQRATPESRGSSDAWPIQKMLARGYGFATIYYCEIEPDFDGGIQYGIRRLYFKPGQSQPAPDDWGALGAWAWGLSRAMDYLVTDKAVDPKRVTAMGVSRLGKATLWAGAMDMRFAAVISNESGTGGAALSRWKLGETLLHINTTFPYWFCRNYRQYSDDPETLPIDQHELLAMIAPRPLYIASASEDQWSNARGEFLSAQAASPVYRLLGVEGLEASEMPAIDHPIMSRIAYHVRAGPHGITNYDWEQYLKFLDIYSPAPR